MRISDWSSDVCSSDLIENLIDNASKYTPEGKNIHVKLGRSKGRVVIEIRDEGVGILREDYIRIFEKFSRIDNPLSITVGVTGLGLYRSEERRVGKECVSTSRAGRSPYT